MAQGSKNGNGKNVTEFIVFRRLEGHDDAWAPVATASAHTKAAACKEVAKGLAAEQRPVQDAQPAPAAEFAAGQFKAVPARSWSTEADLAVENELRMASTFAEPQKAKEQQPKERRTRTAAAA